MPKTCTVCRRQLDEAEFSTNGITKAGSIVYRSSCKQCEADRKKFSNVSLRLTDFRQNWLAIRCKVCGAYTMTLWLPDLPAEASYTCKRCSQTPAQQETQTQGE
jgi:hypothetical protein